MVDIDLVIKMGDTCENQMSMDEARALYNALKPIFSGENESVVSHDNFMHYPPGVKGHDIYDGPLTGEAKPFPHGTARPEEVKKKKSKGCGSGRTDDTTISQATSSPAEDAKVETAPSMPPPNLKVEAARERAAQRTSGCGSRK